MIAALRIYLSDFYIKWIFISALILNVGLFIFLLFFIRQSNVPIVLHYNVDWGVDYLAEVKNIIILPLIGFFIFLFNGLLGLRLWSRNRALSYYFSAIVLISEIFLCLVGLALYMINS